MSVCPYHGVAQPCPYIGCPSGTYSPTATLQPLGSAWIDPLVAMAEKLDRIDPEDRTSDDQRHLDTIREAIRLRQKHLADFPLATTSAEESAQDLADEEARSAAEREAAVMAAARELWQGVKPVLFGAVVELARTALTKK